MDAFCHLNEGASSALIPIFISSLGAGYLGGHLSDIHVFLGFATMERLISSSVSPCSASLLLLPRSSVVNGFHVTNRLKASSFAGGDILRSIQISHSSGSLFYLRSYLFSDKSYLWKAASRVLQADESFRHDRPRFPGQSEYCLKFVPKRRSSVVHLFMVLIRTPCLRISCSYTG